MAEIQVAEIQVDVKPSGIESAIVNAPFDKAKEALESRGYEIISLPQNAQLRIQQGKDSPVSQNYNFVKEGPIYIPKEGNRLVRNSPILQSAKEATQAHREGKEFYLSPEQLEQALEDSVSWPTLSGDIPTNRFGENELTVFAFGGEEQAKAYGEFLKEQGIKKMPIWVTNQDYVNEQEKPFVRALWFDGLGDGSCLVGVKVRVLDYDCGIRGVRSFSGEAGTQNFSESKNSELYTPENISKTLKKLKLQGLENQILNGLRK